MHLLGNQKRWAGLSTAFAHGKAPHTLLISGPPHVGKTTLVDAYSRLLLCREPVTEDGVLQGCGTCSACHQIGVGSYPDHRLYKPIVSHAPEKDWVIAPEFLDSSIIIVELARKVVNEAQLKPITGPRKVLVITQIDRMNEAAQNALLKTFEEPPGGTHIVLTTDNARRLRDTILSRCWHIQLTPASATELEPWLRAQYPDASADHVREALRAGAGLPGLSLRELARLGDQEVPGPSRFQLATRLLLRVESSAPFGALGLTEAALLLAKEWWEEDAGVMGDLKKGAAKYNRAAAARFLDQFMMAARVRWAQDPAADPNGPARLDLMRKTRFYILRNANLNLAMDVMFLRMIALGRAGANAARPPGRAK